jgi:hypothetical protein
MTSATPGEGSTRLPCLYECGRRSGSREHLFPAGCGGIRRDRRITCQPCNNELSPLDTELAAAFAGVNGLLGVRNRHRDKVPVLAVEKRLRRKLSFSGKDGQVRILSRWIRFVEIDGEKVLQLSGDDEVVRGVTAEIEKEGGEIFEAVRPRLIVELTYQIRLSSPILRRAIARLALHYFNAIDLSGARGPGAASLRRYVRHGDNPARVAPVWIDHDTNTYALVPQRFRFGHRIALTFSQAEQRVWGHVCLYSCFGYGIDLGPASVDQDRSFVWDVDPLADREPADQVAHASREVVQFAKPRDTVAAEADHRIRWLFNELRKRNWMRDAPPLVAALNATRPFSLEQSEARIFEILADQRQRLLALATEGISFLDCWLVHPRVRSRVERRFRAVIAARASGTWGVGRRTWSLVEALRRDLAGALARRLVARPLDALNVAALLVGLEGQGIAIRRLARMTGCGTAFHSAEATLARVVQINGRHLESLREAKNRLAAARDAAPAAAAR